MQSKEINTINLNDSLTKIEQALKDELETYGDNATVQLTMEMMTYLTTSLLIGFKRLSNLSWEEVLEHHNTAIQQTYDEIQENEQTQH